MSDSGDLTQDRQRELDAEREFFAAPVPAAPNEQDRLAAWLSSQNWSDSARMNPQAFWQSKASALLAELAAHDRRVRDVALTEAADAAPALVLAELLRSGLDEDETTHQIAAQVGTAIRSLQEGNK